MTCAAEAEGEFETIARLFAPLAEGVPEARGLLDDAAVLTPELGFDLVVTTDTLVEGVHFLPDDPPESVARKLLRVNLSDLIAKGAEPTGYLLTTAWSARFGAQARAEFARGLAADQALFGVKLLGGDTVTTPGPFTASLTAFGRVPAGRAPSREGARPGDVVVIGGTVGDAWLGLQAARRTLQGASAADRARLIERYRLPPIRPELISAVREHARASMDVSDGLIADLRKLASASGVAVDLELTAVPLSAPARAWLRRGGDEARGLIALCSGGDDYQVLCTAAPEALPGLKDLFTPIGLVGAGTPGLTVLHDGKPVEAGPGGWTHALD